MEEKKEDAREHAGAPNNTSQPIQSLGDTQTTFDAIVPEHTENEKNDALAREPTAQAANPAANEEPPVERQQSGEVYSVFTVWQKRLMVLTGSLASLFSPMSSSIYYPSLNTIAEDLHVTDAQINITATTFLIVQGLAPMMIAGFSDASGRRPAYIICFTIYLAVNIALGLQNSYAALLVLRCLQSAGSSGLVALANGLVGDTITSAERGSYIAYASLGSVLGPMVAPVIGGILTQYAGWHWIFWFLLIFGAAVFIPLLLFLPETCRKIVGDGSIPPPPLNNNLCDIMRHKKRAKQGIVVDEAKKAELRKNYKLRVPNPLGTLVILAEKEAAVILFGTGLALCCFYAISAGASQLFSDNYGFSSLYTSLMFIPVGVGSLVSAFTTGKLVDMNYRRHAKRLGFPVTKTKRQDLTNFPIERARLEVVFPIYFIAGASVIGYGWVMHYKVTVAAPAILLFFCGYSLTSCFQTLNVLLVDLYPTKPATATAANNLVRCELGAAFSAAISPMTDAMGSGWAYTLLAFLLLSFTPVMLYIMGKGMGWRQERAKKEEEKKKAKEQQRIEATNAETA